MVACLLLQAAIADDDFDRYKALVDSQAAIGTEIPAAALRDTAGQPVALRSFADRPLVVSLVYTSCHHVCPTITRNLANAVEIGREALGDDAFNVVTIGFDWRVDTPQQMLSYRRQFGIDDPRWYFLSGDAASISQVTQQFGFRFSPGPGGFDHLMQTTIVAADGRIYRQVYGQELPATALVEPLKELVFDTPPTAGVIDHWVDSFRLFCTVYDPNSGRYRFDYSIAMTIFTGILCLGAAAVFIAREWRRAA